MVPSARRRFSAPARAMRNLVASSIRRWRLPLAPNLASADGASEQIVATCYDAESRVTYAVTDACNLYGVRDSAREGDDAELCLEMCLVESVPSATDAFDTRDVADDAVGNDARAGVDGDEKDDERNHLASPRTDEASEAPSNPNEPPLALVGEGPEDGPDASEVSAYQPALREASPIVGAAFVDDLRGVCVACATGELLLVAPDPEDDDEGMAPGAILTKDMAPECVGRVAQGLRAMRWNPDGELLVLATWAGTLILMTKEFRVLAEAPVGGGGGDGVASLSWRGDGQFLASLVAVRGGEPQLRVWEREDLTFHATGESLRPARISAGDPRGNCPSGDTFESSSSQEEKLTLPHAPPLAWQPRGALVAVACAPQRAREDSDVDSTSASDALDEGARVSRRDAKNESSKNDKKRPPPLPATEAEIVFFERNGLRRGSFRLPARGAGVEVTSLAWSCDSERLAVCVADPEAAVFEKKSRSGSGEDSSDDFRGDFGAATQIWRRGNGKWYLSREVRFSTREGPKVYCAWDLSNPDVLRIATPNGRVEEHVFADEISVSSAATTATIDGADVLVTPMARAVIPPPMCAATVAFPATVADVCFCPASAVRTSSATIDAPDAAFSEGQNRFAPRGEAVLALLSDGRLAIASAHRLTEWEETVELLADEDDELEYGKETSHLHHGPDAEVLLRLEAGVVRPVGGVFSILERAEDVPRRVAWLDANTVLVAADRPSDGSASLLMVKLSFREVWDDDDDLTSPRRAGSGKMSSRLAEPRWSCEVVSVTDLPASANAIARAEGENPAGAFVQMQTRCVDASPSASNDVRSHAPTSLFASAAEDEHGDPTLSAVETSWPSASLPRACVALVALPPAKRGAPPTLAGLDARGVLRCGEHVVARDVRSFAAHFGDIGDETLPFSSKAASFEKKEEARDLADAALASASAYAKRWRAWSADDASPSLTRPEARLVYATNSDELRVVELAEVFGEASENGSDPLAATDGGGVFSGVSQSAENTSNAFAAAAGGTRGFSNERDSRGDSRGVSSVRQNDRMHVSMRAAMRPADADRGIDSRTRRIEAGARIVAAPPGGVDVVLQMPRGNLETVAPRFLVLPAVARALDERRFAAAAAVATRHRVDLNLIVDRGWPRFLRHADAFVRDVDDPDVVAELLESLDAGDCTAPGKPYARLAPPTEAGDVSDVFGVDGESLAANGDEAQAQAEDEDEATRPNGLLTSPSVDLVAVARSALADDARASASSRRPTNEGGNSRNSQELASGSSPGTDPEFVSAADEAAAKARRDDPRGKIRLTCSAIARAVARVAAEKARKASSPAPRRGDESRETKGEAFSSRAAYTVVEPAEELGFPEPPPRVAVDAAKSPPVAVSVARFEGMAVASATERAERADPSDAGGGGARDDTVVETLSRRLHETTKLSHVSDTSAAFLSPSPTPPPTSSDSPLNESPEDVDIDHASMRMDVDALLPDRWELVMLSAHARSVPPDLEGALSRVRRRREAEIENARDADFSRDASVVSGTRTEAAKNARLANAIDRVSSMNSDVDSEAALDHLLALEGGKNLFDAAMGTYDLSTAFLVGQRAPGMDPGEYVPELERLQALPEPLRKADVDVRLGRWRSAVENLLKGGDAERACVLAAKRRLFPHAMAVAMEREREEEMSLQANKEDEKDDTQKVEKVSGFGSAGGLGRGRRVGNSTTAPRSTTVSPLRVAVATAYAGQLNEERRHEDAAVALLSVGDLNGAMKAYADGLNWRPALALAGRLQLPLSERRLLASELTDALEQFDPAGAAAVAERELGDVDRAASLLCAAKKWRETVSVAYAHGRGDLVETVVAPAAAEAASGVVSSAREAPARAEKYLERLRKLRERREALERALGADAGNAAAAAGGAVGRPGATRDDDDDGASVFSAAASVSTLASGVSGFSAYTDRTLGAATATTNQTGTSRSASTVGGRVGKKKPTRAERRGKKAGAGLRAGGPTEERDLANHLASGGVAGDLLAPGALEHIGELSELLVVLGHAEDAAKLQGAVSAAIAAHQKASAEARRALDALDAKDAKDGLLVSPDSGGDVSANAVNTNAFANNSTGRKIVPCPCSACVAHRSTHCLAAKNAQWKWAALRDAPLPKKKKATVWDDVAETAKAL